MNSKKIYFFLFFCCCFLLSFSQEKLGIAGSNCYPVTSIFLNPASSTDSRAFIQFNLIGANAYVFTNQAYLPNFSVWQAAKGKMETPEISPMKLRKFLYAKLLVDAPILTVSNRKIGVGFFSRARSEGDIRNIPYEFTKIFLGQAVNFNAKDAEVNLRNVKGSNMTWVEYGVNFSKFARKTDNVLICAGANAKYITGINVVYANLRRLKASIHDTVVDIDHLKGKIRYNEPGWNTGKGLSVDIGLTYKKTLDWLDNYLANSKKFNCRYIDYKYKIGISLLDLGMIRFNNRTFKGNVEGETHIENYNNISSFDSLLKKDFNVSFKNNKPIWAFLPSALSIQGDWNLGHRFYVNGTIIKNLIPTSFTGVQRSNLVSVAPRFEHRQVEFSIPLTLHRFIYPQLGFAFRIRTFVLGFDNVIPFIAKKNTYGLNVYFNLGISIFKNPACRPQKPKKEPPPEKPKSTFFKIKERKINLEEGESPENTEKEKNKDAPDCPKELTGPYMINEKDKTDKTKEEEGIKKKSFFGKFKKKVKDK